MILLQLPLTDLLFAQLISPHIKAVMDGSLSIQQALFFQPAPVTAHHHVVGPIANPFFASNFIPGKSVLVVNDESPNRIMYIRGVYMHQAPCNPRRRQCLGRFRAVLSLRTTTLRLNGQEGSPISRFYLGGSWRRMYLTQPPCATWTTVNERLEPAWAFNTRLQIKQMFEQLTWPEEVICAGNGQYREMLKAAKRRPGPKQAGESRKRKAAKNN